MQVAKINNNTIEQIDSIYNLFPNISFPSEGIPESFLIDNSLAVIQGGQEIDNSVNKLVYAEPYLKDGIVYAYEVVPKTEEDFQLERLGQENAIRFQRNRLLAESDWTQVTDAPVDKPAWAAYRQALRDITGQAGFPNDVTFPNPPL